DVEQPDGQIEEDEGMWDSNDELDEMSKADIREKVRPVKMMLLKLRKISKSIHNSPTLLLPAWERAVEAVKLKFKKLPHDVRTRWNSTFRMLDVALEYREAIERMTEAQANNL
ncbi:hypothetical protein FOMPIDRAFT_1090595, partial [Fomitopsis schrenkii]